MQALNQARRQLRSGHNARIWLLAGALSLTACILLVWGSWRGLLWSRDYALRQIPPAWEAELGEQAFAEVRKESPLCGSEPLQQALQQALQQLGQRLQPPDSPYTLRYSALRNESINAFALPGGQIGIHAALIAKAPGPEALAGVMAHEAAHVYAQHGLKSMLGKMGLGLLTLVIFGDMGSVMLALGGMGVGLIGLSFSRAQETEADAQGLVLLQQAGIDPQGMPAFFSWMQTEEQQAGPAFLSTHPLSAARQQSLTQALQDLPARRFAPLQLDWPALQAAARDCLKAD
ncbi:MAG: M48 family metallopeptidase [Candidatus Sericytochromatia bacterium]|nr:M48 family metallopeptidase [Candidatus Sericytochromatia bacterium]